MVTAVDLFAGGARGWDIHDTELGIETVGYESDETACATAEAAGFATVCMDISTMAAVPAELLKGSPPCQTFSAAGKGAGRKALEDVYAAMDHLHATGDLEYSRFGDVRTGLVLEPLRWALEVHRAGSPYRAIVLEQVPPVLPVWQRMGKVLESIGYSVAVGNLHAEQYGVPQTRKRAVLIARLDGETRLPMPTHSKYHSRNPERLDEGVRKWVSMAEALGWGTDGHMRSNYGTGGDPAARGERELTQPAPTVTGKIDRNKWVYRNGSHTNAALRPATAPAPTVHFGARSNKVDWVHNRPATTVQGDPRLAAPGHRCMTDDCHADREPESMMAKAVRVTVQEAAVLQSLPADYPWQGTKTKQYLQVGNAIPALLAKAILECVL